MMKMGVEIRNVFFRPIFAALAFISLLTNLVYAGPTGGQVVAGNVQISQVANGAFTSIQQNSQQAIINWKDFSIGARQAVNINMPSQSAVQLDRVVGASASNIQGFLNANQGNIFLLNPNGVIFGAGSVTNIGGTFVASTLAMNNSDFLKGQYKLFQDPSKPLTAIVNNGGNIYSGNTALIAPFVDNEGTIVANKGRIALGANIEAVVNLGPGDLAKFKNDVNDPAFQRLLNDNVTLPKGGMNPYLMGLINAIDPNAASDLIPNPDGSYTLSGQPGGININDGKLYVNARSKDVNISMNAAQGSLVTDRSVMAAYGIEGRGLINLVPSGTASFVQDVYVTDPKTGKTTDVKTSEFDNVFNYQWTIPKKK